jgi:preprotein translocase subunit SecF
MRITRWKWLFLGVSVVALIVSAVGLGLYGLRLSVDFTGGSLIELRLSEGQMLPSTESLGESLEGVWQVASVQQSGASQMLLKGETLSQEQQLVVLATIEDSVGSIELLRAESVGAVISKELLTKTVSALVLVTVFILFYIWRQFSRNSVWCSRCVGNVP